MTKFLSLNDRDFNPLVSPSPASHSNTTTLFDQLIVSMSIYAMVPNEEPTSIHKETNVELLIVKAYSILSARKSFMKHIENEVAKENN